MIVKRWLIPYLTSARVPAPLLTRPRNHHMVDLVELAVPIIHQVGASAEIVALMRRGAPNHSHIIDKQTPFTGQKCDPSKSTKKPDMADTRPKYNERQKRRRL